MSDISEKLKALGTHLAKEQPPQPQETFAKPTAEGSLPGEFWNTPHGKIFVVSQRFTEAQKQGDASVKWSVPLTMLGAWANEPSIGELHPEKFAFLDIETTGLGGGTGNLAFMIGVGRFEQSKFHLAQFFLQNPGDETAQLSALEDFLAPCEVVVTYNGKSFEIPVLNTRYTLQRWPSPLATMKHLDLLHLARRLWRLRLASRKLSDLEAVILKMSRSEEDVPGWQVPQIWSDYLMSGDLDLMKGVFYHNAQDILSMTALFGHMAAMLDDPFLSIGEELDLAAVGFLKEDLGMQEEATAIYKACLDRPLPPDIWSKTAERLANILRRMGETALALDIWKESARRGQIWGFVELAKHYEHQQRKPAEALEFVKVALVLLDNPNYPLLERVRWRKELVHRHDRLERKTAAG